MVEQFCDFYDAFAVLKGQSPIYRDKLTAMARCGVLDLSCASDIEGDAIVWHAHLWHYSPPNYSNQDRWGIACVTLREADAQKAEFTRLPWILKSGERVAFSERDAIGY